MESLTYQIHLSMTHKQRFPDLKHKTTLQFTDRIHTRIKLIHMSEEWFEFVLYCLLQQI